jgi:hypothetical protein
MQMSTFTDKLVEACEAEHKRFLKKGGGHGKEFDEGDGLSPNYSKIVGEYWKSIKINLQGKDKDAKGNRPPWSAAFISFVVRKAGAGDKFSYAQAHQTYIRQALLAAEDNLAGTAYVARRVTDRAPQVGDLIAKGRESAKNFTYDKALAKARMKKLEDQGYSSHCDVVIKVDKTARTITSIGGNLGDSVMEKVWKTDANGKLLPYKEKNSKNVVTEFPWIAVLECRI